MEENEKVETPNVQEKTTSEDLEKKPVQEQEGNGEVVTKKEEEQPNPESEKKFTQQDLDNIIKGRLERVNKEIEELKALNRETEIKLAFTTNHINKDREEDIKIWFKGKGEELTSATLLDALKTHPEWAEKISTIAIGNTGGTNNVDNKSDKEQKLLSAMGYDKLIE